MVASVVVLAASGLGLAGVVAVLVIVVRADRAARVAARQVNGELCRHGAAMVELRDTVERLHRELATLLARTERDRHPSSVAARSPDARGRDQPSVSSR